MRWIGRLILCLTVALMAHSLRAQEDQSRDTTGADSTRFLMRVEIGKASWNFAFYGPAGQRFDTAFAVSDVERSEGIIRVGKLIEMSDEGVKSPYQNIAFEEISEIRIDAAAAPYETAITFLAVDPEKKWRRAARRPDRLSFWDSIKIGPEEFVRGSVVTFYGDIEVEGEVNGDVVAAFGDIILGKDAVVRGDAISLNGIIQLPSGSSVYGAVRSAKGEESTRRHRAKRWKRLETELTLAGTAYYNRVDGLGFLVGAEYDDPDSLLPAFELLGGYAFSSDRWRYKLGLTQTILRGRFPLQVGGQYYRLLKSDDDRIIDNGENTVFALLFNEDWKDFYEAEGGYGFVRFGFKGWHRLEIGYLSETQKWLDGHPRLWSLFGAKEFRGNFSSVPYDTLQVRRADFDDRLLTSLLAHLTVDTRDDDETPSQGWLATASYEYSPQDWQGEFDFERLDMVVKRYQPFRRYLFLNLTGIYGRVKGNHVPLNREFFLGGLGTLHGYRHKEYRGHEYLYVGAEYGFRIPRSEIRPFINYDGGKIGDDKLGSGTEWKNALSVGLYLEDRLKVFLARRLDRGEADPVFYARFAAAF